MSSKMSYRLLLGQIEISQDLSKNLEKIKYIINNFSADLYLFPELALTGYQVVSSLSKELIINALRDIQKSLTKGILLIGSPGPDRLSANSYLFIGSDSLKILAEKNLLFPGLDDKFGYQPGQTRDLLKLSDRIYLGIILCFELRSPEIIRGLLRDGICGVIVPSQWPMARIHHFDTLLRARAIESQIYTIGINGVGKIGDLQLGGNSCIYSPTGDIIIKLGTDEEVASVELSFEIPVLPYPLRTPHLEVNKLKSLSELLEINEIRRKKGQKMVFTNGCFDILHAGHVDYLQRARQLGDFLVVGLNSDSSVKRLKGLERPINCEKLRIATLSGLASVDYIVLFDEDTPEELIRALRPDILVKGADWEEDKIVGADFVKSYGGRVVRIPFSYDISTSKIIGKIRKYQP